MAFLKVGKAPSAKQRLYLLEITMPSGMKCVKIGKASGGSSVNRMMEICLDIYQKFRTTPMIKIKRDREVPADKVFKYEAMLHRYFKEYQYVPTTKFSGSTELFAIPVDDAVQAFEAAIEGLEPEDAYILPPDEVEELSF